MIKLRTAWTLNRVESLIATVEAEEPLAEDAVFQWDASRAAGVGCVPLTHAAVTRVTDCKWQSAQNFLVRVVVVFPYPVLADRFNTFSKDRHEYSPSQARKAGISNIHFKIASSGG
jgi:hypothetical protein